MKPVKIILSEEDMRKFADSYAGIFKGIDGSYNALTDEMIIGAIWSTNQEDEGLHLKFDDVVDLVDLMKILQNEYTKEEING